jgi:hypothetical protein
VELRPVDQGLPLCGPRLQHRPLDLVKDFSTGADLQDLFIQAAERLQNLNGRAAFYAPRVVTGMLRRQLVNKKNGFLSWEEIGGRKVMAFDGIPIRRVDALNVKRPAWSELRGRDRDMITDAQTKFSDAQAVTTGTQLSTNDYDMGVARDIGRGPPASRLCECHTAFTGGTSLQVNVVERQQRSFLATVIYTGAVIAEASLTAGRVAAGLPLADDQQALCRPPVRHRRHPRRRRGEWRHRDVDRQQHLFRRQHRLLRRA